MKLFKSLLVAPATIGLLAPFSAFAGEANLNDISKYSNLEHLDLANAFVIDESKDKSLLVCNPEDNVFEKIRLLKNCTLIVHLEQSYGIHRQRRFIAELMNQNIHNPVIIGRTYRGFSKEEFLISKRSKLSLKISSYVKNLLN